MKLRPSDVISNGNIADAYDSLFEENLWLRRVLKEVSGCHTDHNTPKLCEGCLLSIAEVIGEG